MKASAPTTPAAPKPSAGTEPPRRRLEPGAKERSFRAVLAESRGAVVLAPPPGQAPEEAVRRVAPRRTHGDEAGGEREADPRPAGPARPPLDALREPGPASFGPASTAPAVAPAASSAALDPTALVAAAERVLRSLRIGTDAQGRSLVQLDVAHGPLAGCRVELRRVGAAVAVEVRDPAGAPDPREAVVVEALRRRGIEVV